MKMSQFGTKALESGVRAFIEQLNLNVDDDSLRDTPSRVAKAWSEMTSGYDVDVKALFAKRFDAGPLKQMVVLRDIAFTSLCEHHILPFSGIAIVGYLPGHKGDVVGLSKLARLVDAHARRLQIQERMTNAIADDLYRYADCAGCGVHIVAHHSCMGIRGVRKEAASMITTALRGQFLDSPETRAEFLSHRSLPSR